MRVFLRAPRVGAIIVLLCAAATGRAVTLDSGSFVDLVDELRSLSFTDNAADGAYVAPTNQQITDFRALAGSLLIGDTVSADTQAAALGYEVVQFTDTDTSNVYLGVREVLVGGEQTKGWGSYFVNADYAADVMIQAPHPRFDTNTPQIAALVFQESEARAFLLAGSHRNNGGVNNADVADPIGSIFQAVHEQWNGDNGETVAWQLHGFQDPVGKGFPVGTDIVLSNGEDTISAHLFALDAAFEEDGWESYAYNQLAINDPDNVVINFNIDDNQVEDGDTFSPLGGTQNVQGIYSRSIGGVFVHIEMEQSVRLTGSSNRQLAASAIAQAIAEIAAIPEPTTAALLLPAAALLMRRRRRT